METCVKQYKLLVSAAEEIKTLAGSTSGQHSRKATDEVQTDDNESDLEALPSRMMLIFYFQSFVHQASESHHGTKYFCI